MMILMCILSGCASENGVRRVPLSRGGMKAGASVGAGMGAAVGSTVANPFVGAAIGGVAGAIVSLFHVSPEELVSELGKRDIQYVQYGNTHVLIIPTDRYFLFNSHRFNEVCYQGLITAVRLLRFYPCSPVYVAGFTDDVGAKREKNRLSQSRADAMATFLWAHGVRAQRLHAEGYGDKYPIGENSLVHGSAHNRRVEVQWISQADCPKVPLAPRVDSK